MKKLLRFMSYVLVAALASSVTLMVFIVPRVGGGTDKLEELKSLVAQRFIGEIDWKVVEDYAAAGLIEGLGDRWSYYMSAEDFESYKEQMSNSYVGIGVTITPQEDGGIKIIAVVAGGPAEEAGIQVDDVIIRVGDKSILGMTLDDSKQLIQGKENTKVSVTVLRNDQEHTIEVTRRSIKTPVAEWEMLDERTGLVTIVNFNSNCATETIAAIEAAMENGAEQIIFDVRNNPGGYATELVKILDYLLPEGKLFTTIDYNQKESTDMSDAKCLDIPMAVLVNGNSYSAAEFFAAALSEYEAAVIVGEKTRGKGYFQTTFRLPDGSAVGLSIGKYYTPKGKSLEKVGITPDVAVSIENPYADIPPLEDAQVVAALNALNS